MRAVINDDMCFDDFLCTALRRQHTRTTDDNRELMLGHIQGNPLSTERQAAKPWTPTWLSEA